MPVSVAPSITLSKREPPRPIHSTDLPFGHAADGEVSCPPSVVPIVVGEYPSNVVVKPADILANASGWLPPGYLVCDGSAVSRTTYPTLFRIIGTYYGEGDGETTFNLPKLEDCERPYVDYIIKYDVWEHPYCPPQPCSGEPQPVPPQMIDILVLPYPTPFTPPPGMILQTTVEFLPYGYLRCDGLEISRIQYQLLFNMIGTYYGEGDGVTTFNLPNLKDPQNPAVKYIIRYDTPENLVVEINPNMVLNSMTITNAGSFEIV